MTATIPTAPTAEHVRDVPAIGRDLTTVRVRCRTRRSPDHGYSFVLVGETTAADGLVIAPRLTDGHLRGDWGLVHAESGAAVTTGDIRDVNGLHRVAALVADLDWTAPDHGQYAGEHQDRMRAAVADEQARR